MTIVVNMVAGPGTGKSTTAAGVFYELKSAGINAELATEYAKDVVWEGSLNKLGNQVYILGKQYHRLWRLNEQVDVIITDCPLFLGLYYGEKESPAFKNLALELFNSFDNMVYFIGRVKEYNPKGRVQNETKARDIDRVLKDLLVEHKVGYTEVPGDRYAADTIAGEVLHRLEEAKN